VACADTGSRELAMMSPTSDSVPHQRGAESAATNQEHEFCVSPLGPQGPAVIFVWHLELQLGRQPSVAC
jgi:hypothetical protein